MAEQRPEHAHDALAAVALPSVNAPMTIVPEEALLAEQRHPVRPSWNPAEEARHRANVEAAALAAHTKAAGKRNRKDAGPARIETPAGLASFVQQTAPTPLGPARVHSTVAPRSLTITGFFLAFAYPAVFLALNDWGHIVFDGNNHAHLDERARRITYVVLGGAAFCLLLGWFWWGITAAVNARKRTRWAVSPTWLPVSYLLVAMAAGGAAVSKHWLDHDVKYAYVGAGAFALCVYFATLGTYSKTAAAVGSESKYFTRLIVIPWVVLAMAGVVAFFSSFLSAQVRLALYLVLELVQGVYGLTMYQAMAAFDRACAGTRLTRADDDEAIKHFLKIPRR